MIPWEPPPPSSLVNSTSKITADWPVLHEGSPSYAILDEQLQPNNKPPPPPVAAAQINIGMALGGREGDKKDDVTQGRGE